MSEDIRDKEHITDLDLLGLNFIRNQPGYVFRRHYRQGLRSHIMEVLDPEAVSKEKEGVVSDGIKWFPKARPLKMFRIFRTHFTSQREAVEELRRVLVIGTYLGPDLYARSSEFLVTYLVGDRSDILLCGIQEYVEGLNIEPWGFLNAERLADNLIRPRIGKKPFAAAQREALIRKIRGSAAAFVDNVKKMISVTGLIPDLAGDGNLVLTDQCEIKLVDINNISPVSASVQIFVDEKGYPVCDKSVEALYELDTKLAGRPVGKKEPLYSLFLEPDRMAEVQMLEKKFHHSMRLLRPQG